MSVLPTIDKMLVCLVGPYTHPSEEVQRHREEQLALAHVQLRSAGYMVHTPIIMGQRACEIADKCNYNIPKGYEQNKQQDLLIIKRAVNVIAVLKLIDWERSLGTKDIIEAGKCFGKPICYITPNCSNGPVTQLEQQLYKYHDDLEADKLKPTIDPKEWKQQLAELEALQYKPDTFFQI